MNQVQKKAREKQIRLSQKARRKEKVAAAWQELMEMAEKRKNPFSLAAIGIGIIAVICAVMVAVR